jgi:cellulose synthase/poly-beta-1,6-N-acetylglucosamine synthase-like glycosyltransferase/peptidoglycan/xylan/chitin deacetylase (PgdA/CDA1 family)/spore germination protein YaaH
MSEKLVSPVFYDPRRRRWRRVKRTIQLIGAVLSIIFGALIASVLINPVLPALGLKPARTLPESRHLSPPQPKPIPNQHERRLQQAKRKLSDYVTSVQPPATSRPTPLPRGNSEMIGFYVNWDDTSFTSLKQNLTRLDKLIPEWLHLARADGTLDYDDPIKRDQALTYIRQHRPELAIAPLVNNFNSERMEWEAAKLGAMLADPAARATAVKQLLDFVRRNGFIGISIDFENVPATSHSNLKTFMRELYAQFHAFGLEVSQSVPLDDPAFDYQGLAECNDYLILMAYDEHASDTEAGPVASQGWYARSLQGRFAELPPEKYVIAIGNYGYDWKDRAKSGTEISFQEAIKTAQESEGKITLDPSALNPTFDYYDENDQLHHVWFLSAVAAFNQLVEGRRHDPRGFALWRLGSEDPSIWPIIERRAHLGSEAADTLRVLRYGYDIDYEGHGEVLKVTATPHEGKREVTYNQAYGLITAEQLTAYPSPYVITRWGGESRKKIALTFDDGPDAQYTPQILDVLREKRAPATFFVIGLNGDLHPRLLRRLLDEGHEIGNHTFTHPNIAAIREEQLALELKATDVLLQSHLGRRSVLFRPPYAEDVEPETPDQVRPLMFTSGLGYYTIGMQIDPNDWRNPGVDHIVNATIDAAIAAEGNVVLLHDSGGDRSQTVAALPLIIDGLRARGFELVTVSNLMGLTRDAVMPTIPQSEQMSASINNAGFLLINGVSLTVHYLFLAGIVLGLMRLVFVGLLALGQWWQSRRLVYPADYAPPVSVIVPAYNEEKVISQTIHALLLSNYPNFEVIVVDDGSSDATYQRVIEAFGQDPRVRAFTKNNGGKARALNYGLQQTQAEIIIALDADTIFRADAISKLVRHFSDPRVGAVAGNAKVGNRINLLTNWQALEYISSQNLDRRAFDLLNCITVVPGAVGAWRHKLISQANGFTAETLAEDADLTLAILRLGYEINYEDEAVALTEAPDTVRGFLNQRFRWMYGTLQAAWKHRDIIFRPRYGALGLLAIPNVFVFQIFFPLISPVMDLLMLWSLAATGWQRYQHPTDYSTDALKRVLFYYGLFLLVDFLAAFVAFLLERKEDWGLLAWLFFQRFFYRQLMYYVAIKSMVTAIRGTIVGWGKVERKATVQ